MKNIQLKLLIILLITCSCAKTNFSNYVKKVEQTQFTSIPPDLRNYRYGELLFVFRDGGNIYVEVYNSIGLNELPDSLWKKLDANDLAAKYEAEQVVLNGPRYWVLSDMTNQAENDPLKVASFEGIEMALRGILETKRWKAALSKHYKENEVARSTTFIYNKGERVYELESKTGEVYRMQSYSQIVDSSLQIEDLETLGDRLDLPKGWTYRSFILTDDSYLNSEGQALVVTDDFENTYQKMK